MGLLYVHFQPYGKIQTSSNYWEVLHSISASLMLGLHTRIFWSSVGLSVSCSYCVFIGNKSWYSYVFWVCVSNNNRFWISWMDLLTLLYNYNQLWQLTIHECLRLAPFLTGLRASSLLLRRITDHTLNSLTNESMTELNLRMNSLL
jgi:hypothetical protein